MSSKRYDGVKECVTHGVCWVNLNFRDHNSIDTSCHQLTNYLRLELLSVFMWWWRHWAQQRGLTIVSRASCVFLVIESTLLLGTSEYFILRLICSQNKWYYYIFSKKIVDKWNWSSIQLLQGFLFQKHSFT